MEPYIKAITEQLFEDVYLGGQKKFVKGKKVSSESFINNMTDLIKNVGRDKAMPDLFFDRAYKRVKIVGVLSGATFNKGMVTTLLGHPLVAGKSIQEILVFGQNTIKELFTQIASSTITLYSTSIINNSDATAVKQHIKEEVNGYFKGIKEKYGLTVETTPETPVGVPEAVGGDANPNNDVYWKTKYERKKDKYDALKTKYKELKYSNKTKTVEDLLG